MALGPLEGAARARQLEGLLLRTPPREVVHARANGARAFGVAREAQRGPEHHEARIAHHGAAIAPPGVFGGHLDEGAVRREAAHRCCDVRELAAVRARVHDGRAAHGPRYAGGELVARKPRRARRLGHLRVRGPRLDAQEGVVRTVLPVDPDRRKGARDLHHHAAQAPVGHEHVAAQAQREHGRAQIAAAGVRQAQLAFRARLDQHVGRASDAKRRVGGHRLAEARGPVADHVREGGFKQRSIHGRASLPLCDGAPSGRSMPW